LFSLDDNNLPQHHITMKTKSIFIAFCLVLAPACKGQRSETAAWVVNPDMSGSYSSQSEYPSGTVLNFRVQSAGKLSAVIVEKVPGGPDNWIGALGPSGQKYSVEFKGTADLRVTLHETTRITVYAYAHLSAHDSLNPTGSDTDGMIMEGDGAPVTNGDATIFKWKGDISVAMNIASSTTSKSPPGSDDKLTRDVAARLLAASYPRALDRVCFPDQGLQRAQADGLLVRKTVIATTVYEFTDKARQLFGTQIPESISRDERGQLCLSIPALSEQFEGITGVAMEPPSNTATIEYTTRYISTSPVLDKLKPYIYTGNRQSAAAKLYDDGWRLVRQ
jgi:hypothetical protein